MSAERWHPIATRSHYGLPEEGSLVAFNRQAWRVVEVRPVPEIDWDDDDQHVAVEVAKYGGSFIIAPHYVIFTPARGGKRHHYKIRGRVHWNVLPEHYPVCVECGEPYPCLHLDAERAGKRAAEELDRLTSIGSGCCWGCGERITPRQEAREFPGDNLLLPGAPAARFHTRRKCSGALRAYERRWQAATDEQLRIPSSEESSP